VLQLFTSAMGSRKQSRAILSEWVRLGSLKTGPYVANLDSHLLKRWACCLICLVYRRGHARSEHSINIHLEIIK
jgi:hypothetical protein